MQTTWKTKKKPTNATIAGEHWIKKDKLQDSQDFTQENKLKNNIYETV